MLSLRVIMPTGVRYLKMTALLQVQVRTAKEMYCHAACAYDAESLTASCR